MRHLPNWLKYAGVLMLIVLIMPILAACGDDDEEADTETPAAATATSGGGQAEPTATEAEEAEATATEGEAVASPTEGEEAEATATEGEVDASPTEGETEAGTGEMVGPFTTEDLLMGYGGEIEEAENTEGTLIEGSFSDISTLNPIVTDDATSGDFQNLIFEALVEPNPQTLEPVGALAESWEVNEDATVWTINLRQEPTWQDGEPFTADDVKFTYELHMNEATGSSYTADLTSKIESIEVIDDHTVRFNLTQTLVDAPLDIFIYYIIPEHIWADADPANLRQDPGSTGEDPSRVVGTGPFMFEEWVTGDTVSAVRNDSWWGGEVNLARYILRVVPDQAAGVAQLKTGEIDLFRGVPEASIEEFEGTDVTITDYPQLSFTFYGLQLDPERTQIFTDVNVRKALLYALDREAMIESIRFGYGEVAVGTMPVLSWAYNPDGIDEKFAYDPDMAQQLLDEAGWTDEDGDGVREKDGVKLSFTMYTNAGNQVREAYLTAFQEYWAQIGVEMTPQLEPFPALVDRIQETKDFEAFLIGFNWSVPPDQSAMFSCAAAEGGFNFGGYCNEEVDALLQEALTETDQDRRIELYTEFQNTLLADLPLSVLDFPQGIDGVSNRVHNVISNMPNTYFNVETWWVEE